MRHSFASLTRFLIIITCAGEKFHSTPAQRPHACSNVILYKFDCIFVASLLAIELICLQYPEMKKIALAWFLKLLFSTKQARALLHLRVLLTAELRRKET